MKNRRKRHAEGDDFQGTPNMAPKLVQKRPVRNGAPGSWASSVILEGSDSALKVLQAGPSKPKHKSLVWFQVLMAFCFGKMLLTNFILIVDSTSSNRNDLNVLGSFGYWAIRQSKFSMFHLHFPRSWQHTAQPWLWGWQDHWVARLDLMGPLARMSCDSHQGIHMYKIVYVCIGKHLHIQCNVYNFRVSRTSMSVWCHTKRLSSKQSLWVRFPMNQTV